MSKKKALENIPEIKKRLSHIIENLSNKTVTPEGVSHKIDNLLVYVESLEAGRISPATAEGIGYFNDVYVRICGDLISIQMAMMNIDSTLFLANIKRAGEIHELIPQIFKLEY